MRDYDGWLSLQELRLQDEVNNYLLTFLTTGRNYYPLQQLILDRLPRGNGQGHGLLLALENYSNTLQHVQLLSGIEQAPLITSTSLSSDSALNQIIKLDSLPSVTHLEFSLTLREDAPDIQWIDETHIFRWLATRFEGFDDHPLEQVTFNVEVSHHCHREHIPNWSQFDMIESSLSSLKLIAFKFSFEWEDVDRSCFVSHVRFIRKALPNMSRKGMLGFWVSSG
ncbi:hypothetical protein DL96DRAFT_636205 [Flagelloscypha sp. PMI_526]|nr:hypothetical protein DL96DRAFT_636205 [Flagelloscypha sp. PMI_526]